MDTNILQKRQQWVKVKNLSSCPLTFSTVVPQGCVPSPRLFSLYLRGSYPITKSTAQLHGAGSSGGHKNLLLNTSKSQELTVGFTHSAPIKSPIYISGERISITDLFHFLAHIWATHSNGILPETTLLKQQRLFCLRKVTVKTDLYSLQESILTLSQRSLVWQHSDTENTAAHSRQIIQNHRLPLPIYWISVHIMKRAGWIISDQCSLSVSDSGITLHTAFLHPPTAAILWL